MPYENARSELSRLRHEQSNFRQVEVYGGWSTAERAQYDRNTTRIHELEIELSLAKMDWTAKSL